MKNKSKHFNKLFLKRYKKSKAFKYDKEMINEIYNLFVENYKTTGYIFDGSNISYLTDDYIKVNNHTELPKNLNLACIYLKEISNIIYIFDKVLEFNYDMLAMDVIYNVDKLTGKANVKKFINNIFSLTSKCVKNIYIIKRDYDINFNHFENDKTITFDSFFIKIISVINKYIDEHDECKKNYEYVDYLSNKIVKKLNRRQSSIFAMITVWYYKNIKPFFKWLISDSLFVTTQFDSSIIIDEEIINDGLIYKDIVECTNYALDKLNDKSIIDIMFKYKHIPFEERFSTEMQNVFKKPLNEITSENDKQYISELETIGKSVKNDYDNIKIKMRNSILNFIHYVSDYSSYLILNSVYIKYCK
jgi:hypothetical protein